MPKRPVKKQAKSTKQSTTVPALIPRPDGRGALRAGGTPGNAGGPGRPPSEIRAAARLAFDERLPVLAAIADKVEAKDADRIAAVKALGEFGLGKDLSQAAVRERLEKIVALIRDSLSVEQAEPIIAGMGAIWRGQ